MPREKNSLFITSFPAHSSLSAFASSGRNLAPPGRILFCRGASSPSAAPQPGDRLFSLLLFSHISPPGSSRLLSRAGRFFPPTTKKAAPPGAFLLGDSSPGGGGDKQPGRTAFPWSRHRLCGFSPPPLRLSFYKSCGSCSSCGSGDSSPLPEKRFLKFPHNKNTGEFPFWESCPVFVFYKPQISLKEGSGKRGAPAAAPILRDREPVGGTE